MEASLAEISSLPATSKTSAFLALLDRTLSPSSPPPSLKDLSSFVTAVIQDSVGLVISRQVISAFVKRLPDIAERDVRKHTAERALEAVQARQASFEEQVCTALYLSNTREVPAHASIQIAALRELLADMLEEEEDWIEAAQMLKGISLDTSNRRVAQQQIGHRNVPIFHAHAKSLQLFATQVRSGRI